MNITYTSQSELNSHTLVTNSPLYRCKYLAGKTRRDPILITYEVAV